MKMLKNRKALSPVVAAIILIAVTVAVSIAVAAWMGALTFTFMKTEELKITGHTWESATPPTYVNCAVKNTGTAKLTIVEVQINGVSNGTALTVAMDPGASTTLQVDGTFASGTKYELSFVTATGNIFKYIATAPS
jgi:flagellin-like protein